MTNLRRTGKPNRYRCKRKITDLPAEILLMIIEPFFENVCVTSRPFQIGARADEKWKLFGECSLTDLVLKVRMSVRSNVAWGLHDCDFTIVEIARVCKSWRNIVMELTFKQDVRGWDWYEHREKFRMFQLIETKVHRYQKQLLLCEQEDAQEEAQGVEEATQEASAGEAAVEKATEVAKERRKLRLKGLRHHVLRGG